MAHFTFIINIIMHQVLVISFWFVQIMFNMKLVVSKN